MQWSEWTDVLGDLNYWAVVVAGLSSMVVGMVWYARGVFGSTWQKLVGLKDKDIQNADMKVAMGGTMVLALVMAWGLAILVHLLNVTTWAEGASLGLFIGLLFVSTAGLTNYLYEQRTVKLWKINTGYQIATLVAMGIILAIWR